MCVEIWGSGWYVKLYSGINIILISMAVHQCARFCSNLRLVHQRAVRRITKYLVSMSTYVDLPGGNIRLTTFRLVYRTGIYKCISCLVDADFSGGWAQSDANNSENVMSRTGYVIMYAGFPVLWCSKLKQ